MSLWACSGSDAPEADAGVVDGGVTTDAGAGPAGDYAHVAPDLVVVPAVLSGDTWKQHFVDDLLPYWTMTAAVGVPEGNFPTYRGMDGTVQGSSERRPRMIARQTYAYAVGFMLTGEPRLLELSKAGADWLVEHARDSANGGWHARLREDGTAAGSDAKTAQDTAYCMLGLGAYYFVTRDPEVEAVILETRDLLFSDVFWDDQWGRIRDAVSADLSQEVDVENDGGWELVAQLDPINAFLLLTQPVLSEPSRRAQFLGDLERLAQLMVDRFFDRGIFWGVHNKQGQYRSKHVDFGHTLKAYWMILEIDKRLEGHPFYGFVQDHVHAQIDLAYDAPNKLWSKRPISSTQVEHGSDWWIYAELDQVSATLSMFDGRYFDELENTQQGWLDHYVDDFGDSAGEVISGITRTGSRVYNWPSDDTAKCNLWKNGYHSSEHALVLYLMGKYAESMPATLHFAVPEADTETFEARPYFFHGRVVSRTPGAAITVDGRALRTVAVSFDELY